jgi:hypothetical protein
MKQSIGGTVRIDVPGIAMSAIELEFQSRDSASFYMCLRLSKLAKQSMSGGRMPKF